MAKGREKFVLILLVVIAIAVLVGIKLTESADQPTAQKRRSNTSGMTRLVSQQLYQTTQQLEKLVDTRDELRLVRNAQRLADNELDLAFASALRDAKVHPPADTSATKELRDRIKGLDDQIKFGQDQVNS